jgi:hypothetical protein
MPSILRVINNLINYFRTLNNFFFNWKFQNFEGVGTGGTASGVASGTAGDTGRRCGFIFGRRKVSER